MFLTQMFFLILYPLHEPFLPKSNVDITTLPGAQPPYFWKKLNNIFTIIKRLNPSVHPTHINNLIKCFLTEHNPKLTITNLICGFIPVFAILIREIIAYNSRKLLL